MTPEKRTEMYKYNNNYKNNKKRQIVMDTDDENLSNNKNKKIIDIELPVYQPEITNNIISHHAVNNSSITITRRQRYFEKQIGDSCGRHALNMALQNAIFNDQMIRELRLIQNDNINEYTSNEVLEIAINNIGLETRHVIIGDLINNYEPCIFIVTRNAHHIAIRRFTNNGPLYLFDSFRDKEIEISNEYWADILNDESILDEEINNAANNDIRNEIQQRNKRKRTSIFQVIPTNNLLFEQVVATVRNQLDNKSRKSLRNLNQQNKSYYESPDSSNSKLFFLFLKLYLNN